MRTLFLACALVAAATPAMAQDGKQAESGSSESEVIAVVATSKGDIFIQLFPDMTPLTVMNFVNLAQRGYYDGLKFHRVIPNFMIQGGDPLGNGSGNPGYRFEDEFDPGLRHDGPGVLSMANSGPRTNGSQFFITHGPTPHLNDKHSVFGRVLQGQDVVNAIQKNDTIDSVMIFGSCTDLFTKHKAKLDEWNAVLDKGYPKKESAASAEKHQACAAAAQGLLGMCGANRKKIETAAVASAASAKQKADAAALALKGLQPQIDEAQKLLQSMNVDLSGARQTESGLWIVPIKEGNGPSPEPTDNVEVHYTGWLVTGYKFDSSVDRGQPAKFPLNRVVGGWTEGVGQLQTGGSCYLVIPPELGYKAGGRPRAGIPGNGVLVFKVELLSIVGK